MAGWQIGRMHLPRFWKELFILCIFVNDALNKVVAALMDVCINSAESSISSPSCRSRAAATWSLMPRSAQ